MGNNPSQETLDEDVDQFVHSVAMTKSEIVHLLHRFNTMGGDLHKPIDIVEITNMPEFRHNPFKYRIARIFADLTVDQEDALARRVMQPDVTTTSLLKSAQNIHNYTIHFDSFLKLINAFSYRSDNATKIHLAFLLYDFDEDSSISAIDIECMLHVALGDAGLHPQQYQQIASEVMDEVDIDGNRCLNEIEFSRVLARIPDISTRLTVEISGIS